MWKFNSMLTPFVDRPLSLIGQGTLSAVETQAEAKPAETPRQGVEGAAI